MKQVYILTNNQEEELRFVLTRIISNLDIINDFIDDEIKDENLKNAIDIVLKRIESYCEKMEEILEIE